MPHKVLIVDDEINTVISLEFLMAQAGYGVDSARTGDEALRKVDHFTPDLILLDVMLPGVNGFEILQRVRKEPRHMRVAVIMLIAKGRDVEVTKGMALGANAYITKPFSTREVLDEVRRCLDEAENHDTLSK